MRSVSIGPHSLEGALSRIFAQDLTLSGERILLRDPPARFARNRRLPPRRPKLDRAAPLALLTSGTTDCPPPPPSATLLVRASAGQSRQLGLGRRDFRVGVLEGMAGGPEPVAVIVLGAEARERGAQLRVDFLECPRVVHLADVGELRGGGQEGMRRQDARLLGTWRNVAETYLVAHDVEQKLVRSAGEAKQAKTGQAELS